MSKLTSLFSSKTDPLAQARAELARREQRRDAELAQYGPVSAATTSPGAAST